MIFSPLGRFGRKTFATASKSASSRSTPAPSRSSTISLRWKVVGFFPAGKKPTTFHLSEIVDDLLGAGVDLEDADLDAVAKVFRPNRPSGENIISVWRKGKPAYYEVHPELYRALN